MDVLSPIILATIIGFGIPIAMRLGRLEGRLDSIENGINGLNTRFGGILLAFSFYKQQKINPDADPTLLQRLENLLKVLEHKRNHVSHEEVQKFRNYKDKIINGEPLSYEEYGTD